MMLNTPSLLITDDDRAFRETLREVFQPRGFRTLMAGDGEEAVRIVQREKVHLALLDMHMPRLSGLEALRRVKAVNSIVPCILISAAMDDALSAEATAAHAFSVHRKPISFADITQVVQRAMRETYGWPPA